MKISTTAGLVGFLLALSSLNIPKAEAKVQNSTHNNQSSIESRLGRIAKVIKEKENEAEISLDNDSPYIAGTFLNSGNRGIGFLNRTPSFRNYNNGWRNGGVTGWRNGGGGGFVNGGSGFRNGGGSGFRNGGGFRNF